MAGCISFNVISATAKKGFNAESFKARANSFIFSLTTGSSKTLSIITERSFAFSAALSAFSYNLSGSVNESPNNSNILSIIDTISPINFATNLLTIAAGGSFNNLHKDSPVSVEFINSYSTLCCILLFSSLIIILSLYFIFL